MIGLEGGLLADGRRLPDAWIVGLFDGYSIVGVGETYEAIDLKLSSALSSTSCTAATMA